ncbi:MAG: TIGR00282 family metallophosphoesterase [Chloroflexota bacterium]|nr:TIGR00282 family metallophosphoesterase [Chloroflexota bacterium]
MRILMIGDVIGKPGRHALRSLAPGLRDEYNIDLIIANGENAAGGIGLTPGTADELFESGIDVITSGNHIWAHKDILPALDGNASILRPLNYPEGVAGSGYAIINGVLVVNLLGRTFIGNMDCPFRAIDNLLEKLGDERPAVTVVDFHAEATSEKVAMGWYLDGRVSGVTGTHTHVGTIDTRILPNGTAFVCDIGMVGPADSVIGDNIETVIKRFLTQLPHRISVGSGKTIFNSVLIDIDEITGRAIGIKRIDRELD